MPWSQKTPARALTRGQSFLHSTIEFLDHALLWMHAKTFPKESSGKNFHIYPNIWKPTQGGTHQPGPGLS